MPGATRPSQQELSDAAEEEAVRPLLARANLLRMRRQWDDAVTACTEALHRAPRSANAHALLGNIYEGQGKYEDAIEWYVMASEIRPLSPADATHLQQLLEAQRARLRTDALSNTQPIDSKPVGEKTLEWFDRIFPPGRSDGLVRLILAMAASIAFVIALCAAFIYIYVSPKKEEAVADAAQPGTPDTLMASSPILMTPSGSKATASSRSSETALTAAAASPSPASATAHLQATETATSEVRDKVTQALEGGGASVSALTMLPDSNTIAADIALPAVHSETPDHLRERTVRIAGLAAHAVAIAAPDSFQKVMLRLGVDAAALALASVNGAAAQVSHAAAGATVIFAGSAPLRAFRDASLAGLPTSDLLARFDAVQWYAALSGTSSSVGATVATALNSPSTKMAGTAASPSPAAPGVAAAAAGKVEPVAPTGEAATPAAGTVTPAESPTPGS